MGCSLIETPPTVVPVATELAPTPTTLAVATTIASPSLTPTNRTASLVSPQLTASPTPAVGALTPEAYTRQGDTMPSLSSKLCHPEPLSLP